MDSAAVLLFAGGDATRFPGKLEYRVGGEAMVVRSYERVRAAGWPVYIAGKATFPPEIDARLEAPLLIDRRSGCGPLAALLWACPLLAADYVFAVAADQPAIDATLLRQLAAALQPGDEAVVPEHEGQIEPLAALYDRRAIVGKSFALRRARATAMHEAVEHLATRRLACDARHFHNINYREDLQ